MATKGASITNQLVLVEIGRSIPQMATWAIGVASVMDDIGKQGESDTIIGEIGESHATRVSILYIVCSPKHKGRSNKCKG